MSSVLFDELGPTGRRNARVAGVLGLVGFAAVCAWAISVLHAHEQLDPAVWGVLLDPDLGTLILTGLGSTLAAAATAMALSLASGALLAVGLMSSSAAVRLPLRVWTEITRGLPLLLLIFFIYLGAPALGVPVSTFWSLVLGLTLYNASVFAEIFRTGIAALPRGQREAGLAIGLSEMQVLRIILFPQCIRQMLPSLVSQAVVLLKETSLGFIIGYTELAREGRTAVEYLGGRYSLAVYTLLAAIYILTNLALSLLARRLEVRRRKVAAADGGRALLPADSTI